jgi:hypothetical protein
MKATSKDDDYAEESEVSSSKAHRKEDEVARAKKGKRDQPECGTEGKPKEEGKGSTDRVKDKPKRNEKKPEPAKRKWVVKSMGTSEEGQSDSKSESPKPEEPSAAATAAPE